MDEKYCVPCDEVVIDPRIAPCPLKCKSPKCPSYRRRSEPDLSNKIIIWVYGGPGVGKGTQTQKIVQKYGFRHLHIGNLIRQEIKTESTRAKCLLSVLERGELVPNCHVFELLREAIVKTARSADGYVIDGFPREERQGWQFEKLIAPVSLVVFLEASNKTMTERLLRRGNPSTKICDNTDTIKILLRKFHQHNRNIVSQYPHRLVQINAERSPPEIFKDVAAAIDAMLEHRHRLAEAKRIKEEQEEAEKPKPIGGGSALNSFDKKKRRTPSGSTSGSPSKSPSKNLSRSPSRSP